MKWINTKVELEWDSTKKEYIEIETEGFNYNGEVAECFSIGENAPADYSTGNALMSVGDKVLSVDVKNLPTNDVSSEFLLWNYNGTDISSQLPTKEVLVKDVSKSERTSWVEINKTLKFSPECPILAKNENGWYFEFAKNITTEHKLLNSTMEEVSVTSISEHKSDKPVKFTNVDIESTNTYFMEDVLVHS
jgi:hypothetical protein